jgi:hypothetical protein
MRASPLIPRVQAALSKRIRIASKRIYQTARWRGIDRQQILFIVGCMRSGTTLMTRLFDADRDCRVFGERSVLSSADKELGLRLNPLPEVAAIINRVRAPLVVTKPLVETQNVATLLSYFAGSKALFMYRRYQEVALSDLAKFGPRNGIANIRPIAEERADNWRSAGASRAVCALIRQFYSPQMRIHDAAALFWYSRNQLFFDLELPSSPAVMLCQYEHLAQRPVEVMREIYDFLGVPCPDLSHTAQVYTSSVRKGADLDLSTEVRAICEELQTRLDAHYRRQCDRFANLYRRSQGFEQA